MINQLGASLLNPDIDPPPELVMLELVRQTGLLQPAKYAAYAAPSSG